MEPVCEAWISIDGVFHDCRFHVDHVGKHGCLGHVDRHGTLNMGWQDCNEEWK